MGHETLNSRRNTTRAETCTSHSTDSVSFYRNTMGERGI